MSAGRIVNVRVEDLKEHAQSDIVPGMSDQEWEAFKEDVRINGVTTPIKVCKTTIIDGRNRARAYRELHVETIPAYYVDLTPKEQLDEMVRDALHRRHLNESQRAMLGARLKPAYAKAASAREKRGSADPVENLPQGQSGKSRDLAGAAVGVSGKSVDAAEKVIEQAAPEIVEMVNQGELSVSAAAVVAELPKREQKKVAKQGAKAVKQKAAEERKGKIAGGTEFPVEQMEAAAAEVAREDRTDSLKGSVPDFLVDVFSQCRKWQQAMNAVSQAKKTVTEFKDHRAAMFLDFQELERLLSQARVNLKFAMPYTECPKCRRKLKKDCPHCKGEGWLNQASYTSCATDADKQWLEARK